MKPSLGARAGSGSPFQLGTVQLRDELQVHLGLAPPLGHHLWAHARVVNAHAHTAPVRARWAPGKKVRAPSPQQADRAAAVLGLVEVPGSPARARAE
eukprot:14925822-Alexandrium_andersonii.AAC.1